MQETATNNSFRIKKDNNYIVQHAFDDIIIQDNEKLSLKDETYENIDYELDEGEM